MSDTKNTEKKYRLSQFTYPYQRGNRVLLYHSATNRCAAGGGTLHAILNELVKAGPEGVDGEIFPWCLKEHGLFVEVDSDTDEILLKKLQEESVCTPRDEIWIFLTERCNGGCRYCRQRAIGLKGNLRLTKESIKEHFEWYFKQNIPDSISLSLFGGEPLIDRNLFWDAIKASREICFAHDCIIREINVFTNCTTMDAEWANSLAEEDIKVVLSLDGPEALNDMMRGKGRYNAFDNARYVLEKAAVPFGISTAVASHNAKFLSQVTRFLSKDVCPVNVCFIPLHRANGMAADVAIDYGYISDQMMHSYEIAAEHGLYVENIGHKVDQFVTGSVCYSSCGATGKRLVFFPDGTVGPCQSSYIEPSLRKQKKGITLSDTCFTQWEKRSPLFEEQCMSCPCMGICGGGCALDAVVLGRGLYAIDPRNCSMPQSFLRWATDKILEVVDESDPIRMQNAADLAFLRQGVQADDSLPFREIAGFGKIPQSRVRELAAESK